jgi:hypothetical protein
MVSPNTSPQQQQQQQSREDGDEDSNEHFEDSIEHVDEDNNIISKKTTSPVVSPPTPSFIQVGLQRKASPLELKSWIALSLTLDGRDKITKVLQYLSRFLGWYCLIKGGSAVYNQRQSIRFTALYKALANSRKAFRLGRSITEAHKIASMGLFSLLMWHIKQHLIHLEGGNEDGGDQQTETTQKSRPPKTIIRRASSNIGWSPMTLDDDDNEYDGRRSFTRSLSSMAYRKMYRPLLSRMSSTFSGAGTPNVELWNAFGSAMKMAGLLGFWLGDNVNFLTSSGTFDDYNLSDKDRLGKRNRWSTIASEKANQAYFFGAIAGLLTNTYAYYRFRKDKVTPANENYVNALHEDLDDDEHEREEQKYALRQLQKVQEKQFSLFLQLLKSCVDVTVFSNNPGVDLHMKYRGKKNNEGLHCLCGLISAGTVLYNNFPDTVTTKPSK